MLESSQSLQTPLVDRFNRRINVLRISVTDRCNFRCQYCIAEEDVEFSPAEELLSYEEITRLVKIFLGYGVSILRLTGGEPLVRPDLPLLISEIKGIGGSTKPHFLLWCRKKLVG